MGVVPPFVGVAVKVTDVPAQIDPDGDAAMLTLAGKEGFSVITALPFIGVVPVTLVPVTVYVPSS